VPRRSHCACAAQMPCSNHPAHAPAAAVAHAAVCRPHFIQSHHHLLKAWPHILILCPAGLHQLDVPAAASSRSSKMQSRQHVCAAMSRCSRYGTATLQLLTLDEEEPHPRHTAALHCMHRCFPCTVHKAHSTHDSAAGTVCASLLHCTACTCDHALCGSGSVACSCYSLVQ
jgi:hypothetical protein